MQTVVETPDYLRDARAAGITDSERRAIVDHVADNPRAGDGAGDLPVFLLNVFKKGDRVNLSKAEINELREELSHLAREYREGVIRHVKGR